MSQEQNLGEFITLDQAKVYVSDFRKRNPEAIRSYSASGEKLLEILNQERCIGVRIYNGYNKEDERNNLIIIGIDAENRDLDHGLILEKFGFCPPMCSASGALME